MNILFLSRLHYPHIGGIETHVEKISQILLKKGHRVSILTEQHDPSLKEYEVVDGVHIHRIPLKNATQKSKKFAIWKYIWMYQDLIKSADVVHVHDVIYWLLPFPFLHKNIFITYHGYEGSKPPPHSAIIQRKIGEWVSRGTINIGGFMKKWYKSKPDMVLYGAVDKLKAKKKKNGKAIYIGRLHADTGIMMYLKAIQIAKENGSEIKLDVYGSGPQENEAKKFASEYSLKVSFKGFVSDASRFLPKYSYAFVSRYLTILEAFSAQVPIYAVYENQIKKDYLTCHPKAGQIHIAGDDRVLALMLEKNFDPSSLGEKWANKKTWDALTDKYLLLWKKNT